MKKDELTFTKVNKNRRYNMIDPEGERMGNDEMRDAIKSKWEWTSEFTDGNGNVNYDCSFDLDKGTINWGNHDFVNELGLANLISSPLLLYRLISIFFAPPETPGNPYKTIWWYSIKHKKTGKALGFGEWKGASGFWLTESGHKQLKQPFKSDLEELLLFLVSDQIPHPYDGCTSGQVA